MNRDKLDEVIGNNIKEEFKDIKMTDELKSKILNGFPPVKKSILVRFSEFMNREIEIPIPIIGAAAAVFIAVVLVSVNPVDTRNNKDLFGYTDVEIVRTGEGSIVFFKEDDLK